MKVKVYVYAKVDAFDKTASYYAYFCKTSHMGTFVVETSVDIDEPPLQEIMDGTIKDMRAAQQKIRADAEVQYQNIEQQIQEMLCLSAPTDDSPGAEP